MTKLSQSVSMPAPICQSTTQRRKVRGETGGAAERGGQVKSLASECGRSEKKWKKNQFNKMNL